MTDWSVIVNDSGNGPLSRRRYCAGFLNVVIASEAKQSISPPKERMDCFASLAMTRMARRLTAVMPAQAGIQYAAASRFYH